MGSVVGLKIFVLEKNQTRLAPFSPVWSNLVLFSPDWSHFSRLVPIRLCACIQNKKIQRIHTCLIILKTAVYTHQGQLICLSCQIFFALIRFLWTKIGLSNWMNSTRFEYVM